MITLKIAGAVVAAPIAVILGGPALASGALIVAILAGALCWVIADTERAERLALLIQVSRTGNRRQAPRLRSRREH